MADQYRISFTFRADEPEDAREAFRVVRRALRGLGAPENAVLDTRGMAGTLKRVHNDAAPMNLPLITSIDTDLDEFNALLTR